MGTPKATSKSSKPSLVTKISILRSLSKLFNSTTHTKKKMLLSLHSSSSLSTKQPLENVIKKKTFSRSLSSMIFPKRNMGRLRRFLASAEAKKDTLLSVCFDPFEEVKKELQLVPNDPCVSLARHKYNDACEAAINEQINVEYSVSYIYHAMYAYFDRDNVALKGLANFFNELSEERQHAEKLMEYQNKRGGKVKLHSMLMPLSEFNHDEKGDALHAMELALSLEKLNNEKLLKLRAFADDNNDVHMVHFIDSQFLAEQVEAIKRLSEYVSQLRRVDKGHGVWHFDQMLLDNAVAAGLTGLHQ